jgi:coenzyme F420-reducing hydrogenase delta subunit
MAISLPCSGKVDILYLIKAFETGADGVVVLTCQIGECHHLEGNKRARKRAQAVDSLLDEIGAGSGRIVVFEIKPKEHEKTMALIRNFFKTIQNIPTGARMEAVT